MPASDDPRAAMQESAPANASHADPLSEWTLPVPESPDRLPPMLFLAALVHGILIIGITFNAMLGEDFGEAISLEVTIVADPKKSAVDPESAAYLAQASQEGAGNTTEHARPSALAHSEIAVDNPGSVDGDSVRDALTEAAAMEQLLSTTSEQAAKTDLEPREFPEPDASTAIALEAGVEATLPLPQEDDATLLITDESPRQLVTSVDTKESNIASYLQRWKRKIETIGARYLPELGVAEGITGSPTLQVTISASGQLLHAAVKRSSGSRLLDQAAMNILRRASPFDPFPEAIRADYDQLVFAYKWRFQDSEVATTASTRDLRP